MKKKRISVPVPIGVLSKLWKIMRLSVFFLLLFIAQTFATVTYSQETRLTFKMQGAKVIDILNKIENESQFYFLFNQKMVDVERQVSIEVKNESIDKILTRIFENTNVSYLVKDRQIVLTTANSATEAIQQKKSVSGKVTDSSGASLPGVSVVVKGTTMGTITDSNGSYSLPNVPANATLQFSFVGMKTQEIAFAGKTTINVTLAEDAIGIDEVVAVGYGTQKKVNLTGSIATTNAKELRSLPVANVSNSLAARMPGVNVSQNSGTPGLSSSIRIRATGTFNNTAPLYIIDGVVRDQFAFNGLDPTEIENLSVLKDAASAAVYGSRAANGVILVTTRRGSDGKPSFTYTNSIGIEQPVNAPKMQNSYDHMTFLNDAYQRIGAPATDPRYFTQEELEKAKSLNYDWIDAAWKDPITTRHSLDISGGADKVHYFLNGSYYDATGSFKNLSFDKYTLRANIDVEISKNLTAYVNFNLDTRNLHKPFWLYDNDDDKLENLYNALLKRPAWVSPYTNGLPTGNYVDWHPLEILEKKTGYNNKRWNEYSTTVALEYKVPAIPGLKFKVQYNQFNRFTFIKQFSIPYRLYNFTTLNGGHVVTDNPQLVSTKIRNDGEFLYEKQNNERSYQLNGYAMYNQKFGKHSIDGIFVYEQAEGFGDVFDGRINYFISPLVDQFTAGGSSDPLNSTVTGSGTEAGRISFVGRLGYTYDDKYLIEASMRRDGSSTFPKASRWGNFPSFSAAWRISKEPFFNANWVDELKLRASVGLLGNDQVITNQWRERFFKTTGAYFGGLSTGLAPGPIPNTDIRWEKSLTYNGGIDAKLLNNKVEFEFDIFSRKTYDILGPRNQSVPSTFGASLPSENYAQINSKGFELVLTYRNKTANNINYYVRGNMGYAVNKQVIIDEPANIRDYQRKTGFNDDRIFGYEAIGILRTQKDIDALPAGYTIFGKVPQLGVLNYKDIRGATGETPDGRIDENDQNFIGKHSVAPINYGLNLGFSWKNFSMDVLFQGTGGYSIMQDSRFTALLPQERMYDFWTDHWTPENTDAKYPAPYLQEWGYDDFPASTFWMRKGAFLRLKNVNLSYDVQSNALKNIGIRSLKVFVNGTNLLLLQDNLKLRDPEANSFFSYPIMRNLSAGLNLSF